MNIELEDTHISISHRLPLKLKQTSTSDQNIKPHTVNYCKIHNTGKKEKHTANS